MALKTSHSGDDESEGSASIMADINITPLVDIFLVLLIVFMVTSSVMSQMGVDVDLPQASPAMGQGKPEGVIVTLLPSGKIKVNGEAVSPWEDFEAKVKVALGQAREPLVILEGDRNAFLGKAIEVMDHARAAGAVKFSIAASTK